MEASPKSTDERLRKLAESIAATDQKHAPSQVHVPRPKEKPILGPRTAIALRTLTWFFRLFWLAFVVLTLLSTLPEAPMKGLANLVGITAIILVIYYGHKAILIETVARFNKPKARRLPND